MMFGVMGAALAMVKTAKNKKAAIGLVLSAAICAFVCGVTELIEWQLVGISPKFVSFEPFKSPFRTD